MLCEYCLHIQNELLETPLHVASKKGSTAIVILLLRLGADFDHLNKQGMTAGQLSLQNGHYQISEILAAMGDQSLLPNQIAKLPEYIKLQF